MGQLAVSDLSINFSLNIQANFSIGNNTTNNCSPQTQRQAACDTLDRCMNDPMAWTAKMLFEALKLALSRINAQSDCEQSSPSCSSPQPTAGGGSSACTPQDSQPALPDSGGGGGGEGGNSCGGPSDGGGNSCGGPDGGGPGGADGGNSCGGNGDAGSSGSGGDSCGGNGGGE